MQNHTIQPVKLIAGILYRDPKIKETVFKKLTEHFGEIDSFSESIPFHFTKYYFKEMGGDLTREFIGFKYLIPRDSLARIKMIAIEIEKSLSDQKTMNRSINIDPGYLTLDKLVLASTKDYSHRIYLNEGIYADLSYRYIHGSFRPLEWTYPDYRHENTIKMFNKWRDSFFNDVKKP